MLFEAIIDSNHILAGVIAAVLSVLSITSVLVENLVLPFTISVASGRLNPSIAFCAANTLGYFVVLQASATMSEDILLTSCLSFHNATTVLLAETLVSV
tara:strand:- start:10666 stop:10962 length:297 start_codon:yes stop_codon:yes gene_type:complete